MSGWIAGVDGCPAGWIVARRSLEGTREIDITVAPRFETLLDRADPPLFVAVDMPIGLPARIGTEGRGPERLIRAHLGARRSSVFAIPSRGAVEACDYASSCAVAAATSEPPRRVSKQAFMLFARMREIDLLLRATAPAVEPPWRERVFEAHPELAFWRLNGERALLHPKKMKGRPYAEGLRERRHILRTAGLPASVLESAPPRGAGADDLLDALALMVIAQRIHDGKAKPFPDPPGRDEFNLPIAIWA
jgi:predicted RNase H-like nuclease